MGWHRAGLYPRGILTSLQLPEPVLGYLFACGGCEFAQLFFFFELTGNCGTGVFNRLRIYILVLNSPT